MALDLVDAMDMERRGLGMDLVDAMDMEERGLGMVLVVAIGGGRGRVAEAKADDDWFLSSSSPIPVRR